MICSSLNRFFTSNLPPGLDSKPLRYSKRGDVEAAAFQRLVHVPSRSAAPWLAGPFVGAPELSPERIAVAVAVSARYLHDVFQDSGRTVSETLLKLRLEKRHKDLADPQRAPYSIKAIAFRNGFKNQRFRLRLQSRVRPHTYAGASSPGRANLRLSIDRSDPCVPSNA